MPRNITWRGRHILHTLWYVLTQRGNQIARHRSQETSFFAGMLTTGFWMTSEGTWHKIEVGKEEIIHVSEKDVLHQDSNKIWFEGEDLKINGNIIPGVIQMVQYRLLVQEEQFIVERNRLEVLASHTKLPADCELETGAV